MKLQPEAGSVSMKGTQWYTGSKPISGDRNLGYRNPHEHVQLYAATIRYRLLETPENQVYRLPGDPHEWETFQFGTAVCFTNESASFDRFPFWHYKKTSQNPHIKPWEQFSILTPPEVSGWVDTLHFQSTRRSKSGTDLCRLTPQQIKCMISEIFEAIEWTEIRGFVSRSHNSGSIQPS
jgi:hypothetical protein